MTVLHTIKIIPTIPQLLITFQHSTNVKSRWVCPALIFLSSSPYREDTSLPLILFLPNDNAEISIEKEVSDAFEQHAPSAGVELSLLFCCVYFISLFFSLCLLTAEVQISKSSKDGWGSALFDLSLYLTYIYQIAGFLWSILLFRLRNRYFLSYSTSFSIHVCFISLFAWGVSRSRWFMDA